MTNKRTISHRLTSSDRGSCRHSVLFHIIFNSIYYRRLQLLFIVYPYSFRSVWMFAVCSYTSYRRKQPQISSGCVFWVMMRCSIAHMSAILGYPWYVMTAEPTTTFARKNHNGALLIASIQMYTTRISETKDIISTQMLSVSGPINSIKV